MKRLKLMTTFPFIGDRHYVHSSSILSLAEDVAVRELAVDPFYIRVFARFTRPMTRNGYLICDEGVDKSIFETEPNSYLRLNVGGRQTYHMYFFEAEEVILERKPQPQGNITDFVLSSPFSGSATVNLSNNDDYISQVIELNKRLHQLTLAKPLKISNLYMNGFPLRWASDHKVNVSIENVNCRSHNQAIVTLNKIRLDHNQMTEFEVCFHCMELNNG